MTVLVFEVAGHRYAIPARDTIEVVRAVTIAPLPQAPAIVEGIIDVRGRLVPVLDLRSRFRLQPSPPAPTDYLVIAIAGPRHVAIRVDHAVDVAEVGDDAIEDAAASVPGTAYVRGVARVGGDLVMIHDLATFLASAEADAVDRAVAAVDTRP